MPSASSITRRLSTCLLLFVVVSSAGCPPPVTMPSIVGTWQVVSVATAPPEWVGVIDSFQLQLFSDETGLIVPVSGIDIGFDLDTIEVISGGDFTYTFNGNRADVFTEISSREIATGQVSNAQHFWQLRVQETGVLTGTRSVSVWVDGVFALSVTYDESWTLLSKMYGSGGETTLTSTDILPAVGDEELLLIGLTRLGSTIELLGDSMDIQ